MKSIAAFSNSEGGTLLIGVSDSGEILGLDHDYGSLKKQDSDYFEIHLRNLLNKNFGVGFITTNLRIDFPGLEEKEICAIRVNAGSEPAYMQTMDKNGNKSERFYVRSGNSSQEIRSLKEINEYISRRFSER
jgi:predicted HTH transcriptional regulator